jgi:hypothetical protein
MNEFQKVKSRILEILSPLGFTEEKSDTGTDGKGSMQCILAKDERKFMLQWDAEEGMGSVEAWVDRDWSMLESIVPESPAEKFAECLDSLCEELKSQL